MSENSSSSADLYLAIERDDVTKVEQSLSQGADVNVKDDLNQTSLHKVAFRYTCGFKFNCKLVEVLLKYGADVNVKDCFGRTSLNAIVITVNKNESLYEFSDLLLKNGADVNARNRDGRTPLQSLVIRGNVTVIELFLSYGADVNVVNNDGETLLFYAFCNAEVLQLLIDLGLDVNHRDKQGNTPLHDVCYSRDRENVGRAMKCLLKNGANINAINDAKYTPLSDSICFFIAYCNEPTVEKDLKFTIKHVNWNIPDEYNFLDLPYLVPCDHIWRIILNHLAKLEVLNVPVNPNFLDAISRQRLYYNYYKECKEELLRAKKTKLDNTWLTFFNLLVDNRKALKNYAGNEDLIKGFEESDCTEKFPIYGPSIKENLKKGIRRRELFDKSADLLSKCLPTLHPTHLVIRDVLDCILSKQDLSKFFE